MSELIQQGFCSIQPCSRFAEGEISFEQYPEENWPVCERHFEFIVQEVNKGVDPLVLLERPTVFTDDIAEEHKFLIDAVIDNQNPYKVI